MNYLRNRLQLAKKQGKSLSLQIDNILQDKLNLIN